jgi:hypothetical protein
VAVLFCRLESGVLMAAEGVCAEWSGVIKMYFLCIYTSFIQSVEGEQK